MFRTKGTGIIRQFDRPLTVCKRAAIALLLPALVCWTGCETTRSGGPRYPAPIFETALRPTPSAPHSAISRRTTPPVATPRSYPIDAEPGWFPPGGMSGRWTDIVIHHSASDSGGAVAFDRFHREVRHWDELGYHFVIGNGTDTPDGLIEVGSRWPKQKHGAHCKTPGNYYNEHGIGICLVGNFEQTSPTPRQLASLNKLLCFLCCECHIPPNHVVSHGGVTGKTACPGSHFSLARARNALVHSLAAAGRPPSGSSGWRGDVGLHAAR